MTLLIQFSIRKNMHKKGNHICFHYSSRLFDHLPSVLQFIKDYSNREIEEKSEQAVELVPFLDGTVYVLTDMGRNRELNEKDIETILKETIYHKEERREWVNAILQKNSSYVEAMIKLLAIEPFGLYIKELPEEDRSYEFVADLDSSQLIIYREKEVSYTVSFEIIREKELDELCYQIYREYLTVLLPS